VLEGGAYGVRPYGIVFSFSLLHHAHDARTTILLEKMFTGGKGVGGCCQGAFIRGTMCLPKRTDATGQMQRLEILTTEVNTIK